MKKGGTRRWATIPSDQKVDKGLDRLLKEQKTDSNYLLKIKHSEVDSEAYQEVIQGGIDGNPVNSPDQSSNKILHCYRYFAEKMQKRTEEERTELFNRILNSDNKIGWMGNMTLLTSSLNSSLRNYVFEKKVNGEGRKKGMKDYAELSITKDDIVSRFERGEVIWNEDRIVERTNSLSQEIEQIWGIQKT